MPYPAVAQQGGGRVHAPPLSLTWKGLSHWRPEHHPQEHYDQLHRKINHTWDLVVMQAREQLR